MKKQTENVLLKMLVCGESRVGKSLMCSRLATNESDDIDASRYVRRTGSVGFSAIPYEPTIGLDMAVVKRRLSSSTTAKVHLWDTSGDERYLGIIRSYYRCCCAAIVVVDMSDGYTYDYVKKWIKDLRGQKRQDGRSLVIAVFADDGNGFHPRNSDVHKYCEKKGVFCGDVKIRQNKNIESCFGIVLSMIYDVYISQGLEMSGIGFLNGSGEYTRSSDANGIHPLIDITHSINKQGASGSTNTCYGRCCVIM